MVAVASKNITGGSTGSICRYTRSLRRPGPWSLKTVSSVGSDRERGTLFPSRRARGLDSLIRPLSAALLEALP